MSSTSTAVATQPPVPLELRTHEGTVVARLTILDHMLRPSFVAIAGRSFFWEDELAAFVELPP
jgi:hypothetical protein